jgi:hypothetical protein
MSLFAPRASEFLQRFSFSTASPEDNSPDTGQQVGHGALDGGGVFEL